MLVNLPEKIRNGGAVVSVLGLGRIGLPLSIVLARSGLNVIGVDIDERKLSIIRSGRVPFLYPEIQDWLKKVLNSETFTVSNLSRKTIEKSDVIILTVGTPTKTQYELDYSQLHRALNEVCEVNMKDKALIIRSTAAPGTLVNIILPLLTIRTGLKPGVDFALAACPERILEGKAHIELYELPEIIGGINEISTCIAREIFLKINHRKTILETSPTGAELAKLFTNIYRYANFALANEFAIWAENYGEDAHDIIGIANEGYARSNIPRPGFTGGPCLGKDGFLLDNNTTFSSIVSMTWKLNEAIPQHIVTSLMDYLGPLFGMKIAILGLAFKADSDDTRLSPSVKLAEILKSYGANVQAHDPNIESTESLEDVLDNPKVVILATNHSAFRNLTKMIDNSGCDIIYDVWGMYKSEDFIKARYKRFGRSR